jgi:uncharacterized protein (DUF362 family)
MSIISINKFPVGTVTDLKKAVYQSLDDLSFKFPDNPKSVLLKPNLMYYWEHSTGETTNPMVVAHVIEYLRERYGKDTEIYICEADASAMVTKYAFSMLGFKKLAEHYNVKLLNLSEGEIVEKEVLVSGRKVNITVSQKILDSDLFINIPKLKIHKLLVPFSCVLKNLYGAIAEPFKFHYHSRLSDYIVAAAKLMKPQITLIDCTSVIADKYPLKLDTVISGTDLLALDFVSSKLLGFNPKRVNYLKLAQREGLGNPKAVEWKGNTSFEEVHKLIAPRRLVSTNISWSLLLWLLRTYARITGDIIPPIVFKNVTN